MKQLIEIIGFILLLVGVGMIYLPLAFITLGFGLIVAAAAPTLNEDE